MRHPFIDNIMEKPLSHNWKPLTVDRYDDSTNPDQYIEVYVTLVNLYTTNDIVLGRVLPTSLKIFMLSLVTRLPTSLLTTSICS